jgi:hypothetical protein
MMECAVASGLQAVGAAVCYFNNRTVFSMTSAHGAVYSLNKDVVARA